MVCNAPMNKDLHPDAPLIAELGGPTKVAKKLGLTPQRVQNWLTRGIPAQVKVDHPRLFMKRPRRAVVPAERAREEQIEVAQG